MRLPGLPARLGFAWLAAYKTLASREALEAAPRGGMNIQSDQGFCGVSVNADSFDQHAIIPASVAPATAC